MVAPVSLNMGMLRDKLYAEIGSRIKVVRGALRMTQAEVAERAGMDASFYGQIERGANIPSLRTLFAIGAALGVEAAELLPRMKDKKPHDAYLQALDRVLASLKPEKKRFLVSMVNDLAKELQR